MQATYGLSHCSKLFSPSAASTSAGSMLSFDSIGPQEDEEDTKRDRFAQTEVSVQQGGSEGTNKISRLMLAKLSLPQLFGGVFGTP